MTTRYNILLSPDGIALANSAAPDEALFRAEFDAERLPELMAELREIADNNAPEGWDSVLILPEDQILYTRLSIAEGPDEHDLIRASLDGLTPYDLADLRIDWEREDPETVQVAAVATETLTEAGEFAAAYGLTPVGFTSSPKANRFPRTPWFGSTRLVLETASPMPDPTQVPESDEEAEIVFRQERADISDQAKGQEALSELAAITEAAPLGKLTKLDSADSAGEDAGGKTSIAPKSETFSDEDLEDAEIVFRQDTARTSYEEKEQATPDELAAQAAAAPRGKITKLESTDPAGGVAEELPPTNLSLKPDRAWGQLAAACAGVLVLTGGLWWMLSQSSTPIAPEKPTAQQPIPAPHIAESEAPDASPSLPEPAIELAEPSSPDLPQPEVTTEEVLAPRPLTSLPAPQNTAEAGEALRTPPLLSLPPLPPESAQLSLPAMNTTPPVPTPTQEEEVATLEEPVEVEAPNSAEPTGSDAVEDQAEEVVPGQEIAEELDSSTTLQMDTAQLPLLTPEELAEIEAAELEDEPTQLAVSDQEPQADGGAATVELEDVEEHFDIAVIEGSPPEPPKIRPVPDPEPSADRALSDYRPLARPDSILSRPELKVIIATEDTPGYRPALRPAALSVPRPKVFIAVAPPIRPTARPRQAPTGTNSSSIEAAVREASTEPQPSAAPRLPTSASIADRATDENAMRLRQINLIGVFGSKSDRQALVRLSSGRILKLKVGDRLDGGRVSAISESRLTYVKRGKNVVLEMPGG